LFNTYGVPSGTHVEKDMNKEYTHGAVKHKGPSYSQLQKNRKRADAATRSSEERKERTFYEQILAKTIGEPPGYNYDIYRHPNEDSMNRTQEVRKMYEQEINPRYKEHSKAGYTNYQPGGINIS